MKCFHNVKRNSVKFSEYFTVLCHKQFREMVVVLSVNNFVV
jgi:hypothetical protein